MNGFSTTHRAGQGPVPSSPLRDYNVMTRNTYCSPAVEAVSTVAAADAMRAENRHVVRGLRYLQLHPSSHDAVPLTILSGRLAGRLDRAVRDGLSAAHAVSARAHPAGRFVEAHRSGHLVPFTEPELVAREALALLR